MTANLNAMDRARTLLAIGAGVSLWACGCSDEGDDPRPGELAGIARGEGRERTPEGQAAPANGGEGQPPVSNPDRSSQRAAGPRFETPPGFSPWRDPFESFEEGPGEIRRRRNILALALEAGRRLDPGVRIAPIATVLEKVGRADPALATTALEKSFEWVEGLPEERRWPALARLTRGAVRLLPEAGGPFIGAVIELRKRDPLGPGEGEVPLALAGVLSERATPTEERMKLGFYVLSQVGRVVKKAERKAILIELAGASSYLGQDHAPQLLEQILDYAHLAVEPTERSAVRIEVARALASLAGQGARLPGDLLLSMAQEASTIDLEEERDSLVDALAAAADGAGAGERTGILDLLAGVVSKYRDASRRAWATERLAEAWGRFAAADVADHIERAERILEKGTRDPARRAAGRARIARIVATKHPAEAVRLIQTALEEAGRSNDPAERATALTAIAAGALALTDLSRRIAIRDAILAMAAGIPANPSRLEIALAEIDRAPDRAPEETRGHLERAAIAALAEGPAALDRVLEASTRLVADPEFTRALLGVALTGLPARVSDASLRSALAEGIALAGARCDSPLATDAFLSAIAAAREFQDPAAVRGRLSELATTAREIAPLDAERVLVAILEADPATGAARERLAVPFWAAESLAAIGSPRFAWALELAIGLFDHDPETPDPAAFTNLARLASMSSDPTAERARAALERRRALVEKSSADDRLAIDVAIALGFLGGDPREDFAQVERALGAIGETAGDLVYAEALGAKAARLDPVLFERAVLAVDLPSARAAFLAGAARAWP